MGMFDSIYLKCPSCGKELEFQSKTGECMLNKYDEKDLPVYIAIGMDGNIVSCKCGKNIKFELLNPNEQAKFKLTVTKEKRDYSGN